jgi:Holliday junction resolvase-like predicted endonuclease
MHLVFDMVYVEVRFRVKRDGMKAIGPQNQEKMTHSPMERIMIT